MDTGKTRIGTRTTRVLTLTKYLVIFSEQSEQKQRSQRKTLSTILSDKRPRTEAFRRQSFVEEPVREPHPDFNPGKGWRPLIQTVSIPPRWVPKPNLQKQTGFTFKASIPDFFIGEEWNEVHVWVWSPVFRRSRESGVGRWWNSAPWTDLCEEHGCEERVCTDTAAILSRGVFRLFRLCSEAWVSNAPKGRKTTSKSWESLWKPRPVWRHLILDF